MKKTVAAAVAAAFVVSASSTTLAATNPFSDVPRGHWSYKAVQSLVDEGIIEGYGDDYFRGDRPITRYEMAQMIAKALAKTDANFAQKSGLMSEVNKSLGKVDGGNPVIRPHVEDAQGRNTGMSTNKATLDRLAAEFSEELQSLGVRIAELEKHADKVVWTGELRYRYWKDDTKLKDGGKYKPSNNQLQMRLFPTAEVNDHWKIKARMTATAKMHDNTSGDFALTYAFAEGTYDKFQVKVGKMPLFTDADNGLLFDDFFSGARVTFGNKFKVALNAGRWNITDDPASYQGVELSYNADKFYIGAGYHHLNSSDFRTWDGYKNSDDANIWAIGANYNFGNDLILGGSYAKNTKAKEYENSYNIALDYKGADKKNPGSWGVGIAYRYVGANVSFAPTYDTWFKTDNKKGVDIYASWSPLKNTYTQLNYFSGKTLDIKEKTKTFFGRVSWFF